jgi:hypothetical protein
MNNRLEQFVQDHREEFDTEEPDGKIWDAIRKDGLSADPTKKKQANVVQIFRARWSVAAAILLLIAGTTWYFSTHRSNSGPAVAAGNNLPVPAGATTHPATPAPSQTVTPQPDSAQSLASSGPNGANPTDNAAGTNDSRNADHGSSELDASVNEEMYHYAKLVEIKHKELKTIEKDEPLLYRQFSSDVNKLDSVYRSLQVQLPKNPNREQLLEAMLQNLQLQMGLLNHQLDIIKQINHSKKTAYDKAYKTT